MKGFVQNYLDFIANTLSLRQFCTKVLMKFLKFCLIFQSFLVFDWGSVQGAESI